MELGDLAIAQVTPSRPISERFPCQGLASVPHRNSDQSRCSLASALSTNLLLPRILPHGVAIMTPARQGKALMCAHAIRDLNPAHNVWVGPSPSSALVGPHYPKYGKLQRSYLGLDWQVSRDIVPFRLDHTTRIITQCRKLGGRPVRATKDLRLLLQEGCQW